METPEVQSSPSTEINQVPQKNNSRIFLLGGLILVGAIFVMSVVGFLYWRISKRSFDTAIPNNSNASGLHFPTASPSTIKAFAEITPTPTAVPAMNCIAGTDSWKTCTVQTFSVQLPLGWKPSKHDNAYFFTSAPGENNLVVIQTPTEPDFNTGVPDAVENTPILLGGEKAIQLYGCIGVESCQNEYLVSVKHADGYFELEYLPYNLPDTIYSHIISSFRFTQ